jgi:hypothetical protein
MVSLATVTAKEMKEYREDTWVNKGVLNKMIK